MNAIDLLVTQHRAMERELAALLKADPAQRGPAFARTGDLLMAHVLVEEQHFYPAVNAKRTEDVLLESLEEHLSLKRLLADLVGMAADDARFEPKLHVLKEQAEHHHKEEEEKLFPAVRKLLSGDELDALGELLAAEEKRLIAAQARHLAPEQTDEAAELP